MPADIPSGLSLQAPLNRYSERLTPSVQTRLTRGAPGDFSPCGVYPEVELRTRDVIIAPSVMARPYPNRTMPGTCQTWTTASSALGEQEKTCRTCDVMTHFVMSAVRAGMGLPRDDPTFNIHDWEDGDGSEYDSDAECQFRKPWEFYGTGDSD